MSEKTQSSVLDRSAPADSVGICSRRRFLRRLGALAALPVAGGIYGTQIEPFWLSLTHRDIWLKGLPTSFDHFRLIQISDLHAGLVPMDYLRRAVDLARRQNPDAVAMTGDLINHDPAALDEACDLLLRFECPVYQCLGNHDYDPDSSGNDGPVQQGVLADRIEKRMEGTSCHLLRNAATEVNRNGQSLWFVGLEDFYTNRFDPKAAFAAVGPQATKIVLSHNPDTAPALDGYGADLILSGHTHGGQVRLPGIGAVVLPITNRRFDQGLFQLRQGQLHVSRGLGYAQRIRFNCRPEIAILTLRSAAASAATPI